MYQEPHAQAAAYLGVSYRHLLSVLAAFQREGLVEKTPEGYHLRDWAGLRALQIPDVLSPLTGQEKGAYDAEKPREPFAGNGRRTMPPWSS